MLGLQANNFPLFGQPRRHDLVGLIDVTHIELEGESLRHARFSQQAACLGAGFLDVGPVPRDLFQLCAGRRQRVTRCDHTPDGFHNGYPGEVLGAAPAINRQGKRAAHAGVVERLHPMIRGDQQHGIPVGFLDRDLIPQGASEDIATTRREAAKLDHGRAFTDRPLALALLLGQDRVKAVQVGQAFAVVVRVALAIQILAALMLDENESPGSQDILLVPAYVLGKLLGAIYVVIRVGEGGDERRARVLQLEDDGGVIRGRDLLHHDVETLAGTSHTLRRKDNLVEACHDVVRRYRLTVPELSIRSKFKRVFFAPLGGLWHRQRQITHEISRRGGVFRIHADQDAVEGCGPVEHRKGAFPVSVVAWRFAGDDEVQNTATLRRFRERQERGEP